MKSHPIRYRSALALTLAAVCPAVSAEESGFPPAVSMPDAWEDWNDWGIGGVLFPDLHMHGIGGFSSGDPGAWQEGEHDPKRQAFSAQAIEPGISLKTEYVQGFANGIWFQDVNGDWDGEWEEGFLKLHNLPGGLELRGGRFLSRYGAANDRHLHAWDFVDAELANARFLGEHGILLEGVELSWKLPLRNLAWTSMLTFGIGDSAFAGEDHAHGGAGHEDHDEEDHDDHEEEDHDDEDHDEDHDGEDHDDHDDANSLFDSHESALEEDIATARALVRYQPSDFHSYTGGLSWAGGTNGYGRDTHVAAIDFEYLWRERGMEPGGKALRWRTEYLWRDIDARDEDAGVVTTGNYEESGLHTHLIGTWNQRLDAGLRLAWVEGVSDLGLDERFRISPAVTWYLDDSRRMSLRVQTNHDWTPDGEDNHAVWFQFNIALGSTEEVR